MFFSDSKNYAYWRNIEQQKHLFIVMAGMRYVLLWKITFAMSSLLAQQRMDYIIKSSKDTIYTRAPRINKGMSSVVCEEKGKNVKYAAKDVLELRCDTLVYETGLARLKKSYEFIFLRRIVKGKLCLYEASVMRSKFSWSKFGYDIIRFRWIYQAQSWFEKYPVITYFYKKENETREEFSKSWKEKTKDCKTLNDKITSREVPWSPSPVELVRFYNENCK